MDSLSKANQAEILQFMEEEKNRQAMQAVVSKVTDACWEKCITGTPAARFNNNEANCLSNCAKRYTEMSILVVQHLHSKSSGSLR